MAAVPMTLRSGRVSVFRRIQRQSSLTTLVGGPTPKLVTEPLQFIAVRYSNGRSKVGNR